MSGLKAFVDHCRVMAKAAGTGRPVETDQGLVEVPEEHGPVWERLGNEAATRL